MKRPRYTLRVLLVVVTLMALTLGVWRVFTNRRITRKESERVKIGMSSLEVQWNIGAPYHSTSGPNGSMWRTKAVALYRQFGSVWWG